MDSAKLEQTILQTHCRWELSTRFVKMTANYHKIDNLNNSSLTFLSLDCTYQLFLLVSCARKIAHQCKRTHLKGSDIISALKLCSFDHLYGHYPQMNYQVQTMNHATARLKGLMTYVDKEFDLESLLSQPPLKLPREIIVHGHWLSINGEVPDIGENIPQNMSENVLLLESNSDLCTINRHHSNTQSRLMINRTKDSIQNSSVFSDRTPMLIERQLIYKELTELCFGQNESKKKEALNIVSTDQVMKELIPHFSCFIKESIKLNIQQPNLGILLNCVRVIKAIFDNNKLKPEFIQNNLHYFVPSLLNCIITRQICIKPESENHWALRCFASKTLANICNEFQLLIPSLSLRVCNIAIRTLECSQCSSSNQQCFLTCTKIINTNNDELEKLDSNDDIEEVDDVICQQNTAQSDENGIDQINTINKNSADTPSDIDINSIPFSSYYGAVTLLFDINPNIAKLTTLPLFSKLGHLIGITLDNQDSNSHLLAKIEAEQLKELLVRQGKFIIRNFFTSPDILDSYIMDYGNYLGPLLYREIVSCRGSVLSTQPVTTVSTALNVEKQQSSCQNEDKQHVL